MELKVSGPFHSGMLTGAGEKLAAELKDVRMHAPQVPYVSNVNAMYVDASAQTDEIKELLTKQVSSSVLFEQSVRKLIADGVDTFYEIGPGHTLTGFVKKTAKDMGLTEAIKTVNIEKVEDYEKL